MFIVQAKAYPPPSLWRREGLVTLTPGLWQATEPHPLAWTRVQRGWWDRGGKGSWRRCSSSCRSRWSSPRERDLTAVGGPGAGLMTSHRSGMWGHNNIQHNDIQKNDTYYNAILCDLLNLRNRYFYILLLQGTLTEGESSVWLASSVRWAF